MDHLIKDSATLELYAWLDPDAELPGWDVLNGNPFGTSLPEDQFTTVPELFRRVPSRYYRQRLYNDFPSRLHALLLFATPRRRGKLPCQAPGRVFGKYLVCARSKGAYVVSFHDSSWLDSCAFRTASTYPRLTSLKPLLARPLVEEIGLRFMNERWWGNRLSSKRLSGTLEPINRRSQTLCCLDFPDPARPCICCSSYGIAFNAPFGVPYFRREIGSSPPWPRNPATWAEPLKSQTNRYYTEWEMCGY